MPCYLPTLMQMVCPLAGIFKRFSPYSAMNGLDDLRGETSYTHHEILLTISGWTLNNAIQAHIDVYVSQHTFTEVQRAFPYLVSKEFASGGGDVRQFKLL